MSKPPREWKFGDHIVAERMKIVIAALLAGEYIIDRWIRGKQKYPHIARTVNKSLSHRRTIGVTTFEALRDAGIIIRTQHDENECGYRSEWRLNPRYDQHTLSPADDDVMIGNPVADDGPPAVRIVDDAEFDIELQ